MAALNRPTTASYEVHENVRVDTQGTWRFYLSPKKTMEVHSFHVSCVVLLDILTLFTTNDVSTLQTFF